MLDKDHIEIAQKHLFSKEEHRHLKSYAHSMLACSIELRKIRELLEILIQKENDDERILGLQGRGRIHEDT